MGKITEVSKVSKTLARHTDLKIILLDERNNYVKRLSLLMTMLQKVLIF